jgi:hypothetical protein
MGRFKAAQLWSRASFSHAVRLTGGQSPTITSRRDSGGLWLVNLRATRQIARYSGNGARPTLPAIFSGVQEGFLAVVLNQSDVLEVRQSPGKGRGVFAKVDIPKGTVFERVPLLVVETEELEDSRLMDYVFVWSKKSVAIALGYGSLYNHSYKPNARYYDGPGRTKVFMAVRTIRAGEEILVNYNGDPKSREKVEFDVIESANGHVHGVNGKSLPLVNGHAPPTSKSAARVSAGRKRKPASA